MAEDQDADQKTEQPTERRKQDAVEKGDVLQSRELGTALVVMAGAAWLALAGPWMRHCTHRCWKKTTSGAHATSC